MAWWKRVGVVLGLLAWSLAGAEEAEVPPSGDLVSCKVHDIEGLSRTGPGGSVRVLRDRFFIPDRCTQVNLAELDLSDEAVMPLGRYLPSCSGLLFLNLGSNRITDEGVRHVMAGVAHSKLTHLNLAYNDLTDKAVVTIASVLETGCSLQVLWLGGNHLTEESGRLIARALAARKTRVLELWLGETQISEDLLTGSVDPIIEENRQWHEKEIERDREAERERVVEETERQEEEKKKKQDRNLTPELEEVLERQRQAAAHAMGHDKILQAQREAATGSGSNSFYMAQQKSILRAQAEAAERQEKIIRTKRPALENHLLDCGFQYEGKWLAIALSELGVDEVEDLQYVTDEQVASLKLKPVKENKFKRCVIGQKERPSSEFTSSAHAPSGSMLGASPQENSENNASAVVEIKSQEDFVAHVLQSQEDVLVDFYAPWCAHCESAEGLMETLAHELAKEPVTFAKMSDEVSTRVDMGRFFPELSISDLPSIVLFSHTLGPPVLYTGEFALAPLRRFVERALPGSEIKPTKNAGAFRVGVDDASGEAQPL